MKPNLILIQNKLDIINDLATTLNYDKSNIIIGGSMSLFVMGITDEVPNDIDIDMQYSDELAEKLALMDSMFIKSGQYPNTNKRRFDFIYKNEKINVWLTDNLSSIGFMYMNYFKYKNPMEVLDYKIKYGRKKDLIKVFELIKDISTRYLNYHSETKVENHE